LSKLIRKWFATAFLVGIHSNTRNLLFGWTRIWYIPTQHLIDPSVATWTTMLMHLQQSSPIETNQQTILPRHLTAKLTGNHFTSTQHIISTTQLWLTKHQDVAYIFYIRGRLTNRSSNQRRNQNKWLQSEYLNWNLIVSHVSSWCTTMDLNLSAKTFLKQDFLFFLTKDYSMLLESN